MSAHSNPFAAEFPETKTLDNGAGVRFDEVQRLWSNMIARVMLPMSLVIITVVIVVVSIQKPAANLTVMLPVLALATGIEAFVIFGIRQRTQVDATQIRVSVRPLSSRTIALQNITSAQAIKYNPLVDTGGWGIRRSRKYGRVYNMAGDRGVHIVYTDTRDKGKERNMLIGSMRADELVAAIDDAQAGMMSSTDHTNT